MTDDGKDYLESPDHVRTSLAAAMTLDFKPGLFFRNARLHCINLLLTYRGGCAARCAYCGLSGNRPGEYGAKSFIRVSWPTYPLREVIGRIRDHRERVKRICISMITNLRSAADTREVCSRLRSSFDIPVSLLISPTILKNGDLEGFKAAGADKVGVAIDLATRPLFERLRGPGVGGPHRWETYWECLARALEVFGDGQAGAHFMVGMGETEKEMCCAIQRVRDMGGRTHLFSFFPEAESRLARRRVPPMAQYRRIQLARYLIDEGLGRESGFEYDQQRPRTRLRPSRRRAGRDHRRRRALPHQRLSKATTARWPATGPTPTRGPGPTSATTPLLPNPGTSSGSESSWRPPAAGGGPKRGRSWKVQTFWNWSAGGRASAATCRSRSKAKNSNAAWRRPGWRPRPATPSPGRSSWWRNRKSGTNWPTRPPPAGCRSITGPSRRRCWW